MVEPLIPETAPSGLPRYAQVANDLTRRIADGIYPVGSLLPREVELSAEYGISRHTVREALRRLNEAGLVSRRRRAGTEVLVAEPATRYRQPISSIEDLLQYGEATDVRLIRKRIVRCDAELATMLECEKGRGWLRFETVRTQPGDKRPVCHTTMYLTLDLEGIAERVNSFSLPISAMVERDYGLRIAAIEQSLRAVSLDAVGARRLKVEANSPALEAVRRYYDERGHLLELAIAVHPGERFAYTTRLSRR
jgi:GntR family transcriptional regulator